MDRTAAYVTRFLATASPPAPGALHFGEVQSLETSMDHDTLLERAHTTLVAA